MSSDYHRPRRPEPDTIAYLRSFPLDLHVATHEIEQFLQRQGQPTKKDDNKDDDKDEKNDEGQEDDDEDEKEEDSSSSFPNSFAAALSALYEIRNEIASLAGDEQASEQLEVLVRLTAPFSALAARCWLYAVAGYGIHLATHRYGSHVLQSILECATVNVLAKYPLQQNNNTNNNTNNKWYLDLALHEEAPPLKIHIGNDKDREEENSLPTLTDLLWNLQAELSPAASDLARHVCGSHVLRTLACVLGGVQQQQQQQQQHNNHSSNHNSLSVDVLCRRRGKFKAANNKNNKKRKKASNNNNNNNENHNNNSAAASGHAYDTTRLEYIPNSRIDSAAVPTLQKALYQLVDAITGYQVDPPGELQILACHTSASPLLITLLRVLTYCNDSTQQQQPTNAPSKKPISNVLGLAKKGPQFQPGSPAHELAKRLLCWIQEETPETATTTTTTTASKESTDAVVVIVQQPHAGDVIFGLAGESIGSHVLECILECSYPDFHHAIVEVGGFYTPDTLQEYVEHHVSNFVVQVVLATTMSASCAERLITALLPTVVSTGLVIDPARKRRGVLWRLVELSAKFQVQQEQVLSAMTQGFLAVYGDDADDQQVQQHATQKGNENEKSSSNAFDKIIPRLVALQTDAAAGGTSTGTGRSTGVVLDASGTRTLYHLLRFEPRLCKDILKGIFHAFSRDDLELLAKDALGSRCVWDGILDGPVRETSVFAKALPKLVSKLSGRWVALATDRVGHHMLLKLFRGVTEMKYRERIVEELSHATNRLVGNAMGRSVMEVCAVHEYKSQGKDEWQKIVKKKLEKEEWLRDIVESASGHDNDTKIHRDNEKKHSEKKSKKKSKKKERKRNNENKHEDEESSSASESESPRKTKRRKENSSSLTVESIMDAMSLPAKK